MKLQKIAGIIFIIFLIVTTLILAQNIIIPLILAIFLWFLIKEFREFMDKSNWIKNKIPRWIKTLASTLLFIFILGFVANILISNIQKLTQFLPKYSDNLNLVSNNIEQSFGFNITEKISNFGQEFDFQSLASEFLNSITDLLSNTFLILIYLLFILMEESIFLQKLKAIYNNKEEYNRMNTILSEIDFSIGKYISIKALLSFITSFLSFLALYFIGIDFAFFWAIFIFILNFIPSVGSLIATLFPALMALVQFGGTDYTPFVLVLVFVGAIQVLVGNFLDPKMMGNSLNISALVVILSLSIWGSIWGIIGMVLSVPISVILIIVFSHFESTRAVAILLSKNGTVGSQKQLTE